MKNNLLLGIMGVWLAVWVALPGTALAQAGLSGNAPSSPEELFQEGNAAYEAGDYGRAIALYDSLHATGLASTASWYNLGNAHFEAGHTAEAVLNYERALRLAPARKDIRNNLLLAKARIPEAVAEVPVFFLTRWGRAALNSRPPGRWLIWSAICMWLAAGLGFGFFRAKKGGFRMAAFWGGIGLVVLSLVFLVFAWRKQTLDTRHPYAVLMAEKAWVKNTPDAGGQDLVQVYGGTKVRFEDAVGEWVEVSFSDRSRGWLERDALEKI
jgi:tetratricopeptide (TPR) repeat protein